MLRRTLLLLAHVAFAQGEVADTATAALGEDRGIECQLWCIREECKVLRGNLTQECGACNQTATCNPGAADWADNKLPTTGNPVLCKEWCHRASCDNISGDPEFECGGCGGDAECKKGAAHFDDYMERKKDHKNEL